jgi:polyhydroxyalkanoate synthesis regulator protein
MLNKPEAGSEKKEAVVIKKYANRRLYNTETSTYVTLDDLATMVRNDKDFVVYDAKTGDDLTHSAKAARRCSPSPSSAS